MLQYGCTLFLFGKYHISSFTTKPPSDNTLEVGSIELLTSAFKIYMYRTYISYSENAGPENNSKAMLEKKNFLFINIEHLSVFN